MRKKNKIEVYERPDHYYTKDQILDKFGLKTVSEVVSTLSLSYGKFKNILKRNGISCSKSYKLKRGDVLKIYGWLEPIARRKSKKPNPEQDEKIRAINSKESKSSIGHGNTIYDKVMKSGKRVYWHYNPFSN